MANCLKDLEREGGSCYRRADTLDKGLTPALLEQCAIVLWDQPGTGLLECLAAGIPTMVVWPRLFNREEPRRERFFHDLETAGIIHASPGGLLAEAARFKAAPEAWMDDPFRRGAVDRFLREFGWNRSDWPRYWKRFLAERSSRGR
jgi:putative transferase (TIGR04331 family)